MTFDNNIAQRRKKLALTQQQLAERLGVSRQTVISLENGRFQPSLGLAFGLAEAFDSPIEAIFTRASRTD